MTNEAEARECRRQGEQEIVQWFHDACAEEDRQHDLAFDC
jgi:hypothetical protein